ncbi:MAG: ATP-binding protein [bacterium]|nr:ATP-binding protein [bacterium]
MKRINEKVKDIVDVRKFQSLRDFSDDAAATLSAYRFTDATSELMAKWLDQIVRLQGGQGSSLALAGYRGVGKSHFLATLAAIVGYTELRTKISDPHVSSAAQALLRRRYPCLMVKRGTRPSLLHELKYAVGKAFDLDDADLPERLFDVVALARARAGDMPFLVLVDTAMERSSRVTRDDGAFLAELAEAVSAAGGFVGVALDDDIAGADGSNAAIVRSFSIDYLDQEHLYKVVDSFVFPKKQALRPVLHDVYEYFREVMPTFRWSEQRFASLYPLHPAILDVAPFIRLYVNDFALLSFASDAGERILGRPANSLIALDEVFDSAENELRKVEDLRETFDTYDRLNSDVVARIPVMQRLQAKLVLKALLILSLEGQGTTAGEISSGTLIFDESDPKKANKTVEEIIRMFAAAMPDEVRVYAEEGREVRYGLCVSGNDGLNEALDSAAALIDDSAINEALQRLFHDRFSDSLFFGPEGTRKAVSEASLIWRGGNRRGRVIWQGLADGYANDDHHDWEVLIDLTSSEQAISRQSGEIPNAIWHAAELTPDERDAIKRFHVLQNDVAIRAQFPDQVRGAFHSHLLVLDRTISRAFFEDGRMIIDGFDYNLSDEARTAPTLSILFSTMLEPLFETRYPQHPFFFQNLGLGEVSSLVSDLYSGSRQKLGDVQQLAQAFALPLGLVKLSEGVYYPSSKEQLVSLDLVKRIEAIVERSGSGSTDLKLVYEELRQPPNGIVREAQQLILAAMVSQRMIEFVTSKGDRINQRSLDLRMIWDDIVGLARPQDSTYSIEKLTQWAKRSSNRADIVDIGIDSDLLKFREGAQQWLAEWDSAKILGHFNGVPEESLNTVIWKSVTRASRTLGASASLLRKYLDGQSSVEECLGRISETFQDEPERFERAKAELETVSVYLESFAERGRIERYVLTAASTEDPKLEAARAHTLSALAEYGSFPDRERNRQVGYAFSTFRSSYISHYVESHDSVMRSHALQQQAADLLESEEWWFYENIADLVPNHSVSANVSRLRSNLRRLDCTANTQELLEIEVRCACGYETPERTSWESIVSDVKTAFYSAIDELLERLREFLQPVAVEIGTLGDSAKEEDLKTALQEVERFVHSGTRPEKWSSDHARAFRLANSCIRRKHPRTGRMGELDNEPFLTEADVESAVLSLA